MTKSEIATNPLFYIESNKYLIDLSSGLNPSEMNDRANDSKQKQRFYLPLDVDTEFQTFRESDRPILSEIGRGSITITVQMKAVSEKIGKIFAHKDLQRAGIVARHPTIQSDFCIVDYLQSLGIKAELGLADTQIGKAMLKKLRTKRILQVNIYAHFAVADIIRLFNGSLRETILTMCRGPVGFSTITQKRRLKCEYTPVIKGKKLASREIVQLPCYLEIEGVGYALELSVIDSGALHGIAGLSAIAQNTGTPLDAKSDLGLADKVTMLETYQTKPDEFDRYALGDLAVYTILENNREKFGEIYDFLGIGHRKQIPKLTIGATVADFQRQMILEHFGPAMESLGVDDEDDLIDRICAPACSERLIERENKTGGLFAKTLGGRCYRPRARDTSDEGLILDTDFPGAYSGSMRVQTYPFGNPVIIDYDKHSHQNDYLSLRQVFSKYGKEFVPGLYQLWFRVIGDLPTPQDFFNSYHPPKRWSDIKSETELLEESNWLDLPDYTKIYSHQIEYGLMTHDGKQWLDLVASRELKNAILDNSEVVALMYYPKSQRVNSPEELLQKIYSQTNKNECEGKTVNGKTEIHYIERDEKAWYGVNLGDFIVNQLQTQRARFKPVTGLYKQIRNLRNQGLIDDEIINREKGKFDNAYNLTGLSVEAILEDSKSFTKHPLDELFKLCVNTLYGVTISRYFTTSNSVVGNNITARVRAAGWYLEKGGNAHNIITDGGAYNVNLVTYVKGRYRLNDKNATLINRKTRKQLNDSGIRYAPLGGYDEIKWAENGNDVIFVKDGREEILEGPVALKKIDAMMDHHLKSLFPGVDVFWAENTDLSGKKVIGQFGFESKGIVRQSAYHGQSNYIFRGGFHDLYKNGTQFVAMRSYTKNEGVVVDFLSQLLEGKEWLDRQSPFEKTQIVKVGEYKQRYNAFYSNHSFTPGDTLHSCGLLREFSLSQFTYRNRAQRESWEKHVARLKQAYGQSIEGYFENEKGQLNYQKMVDTVDLAISEGCENFKTFIDKHRNRPQSEHPNFYAYLEMKSKLALYGIVNPSLDEDLDFLSDDDIDYGDHDPSLFGNDEIVISENDLDFDL